MTDSPSIPWFSAPPGTTKDLFQFKGLDTQPSKDFPDSHNFYDEDAGIGSNPQQSPEEKGRRNGNSDYRSGTKESPGSMGKDGECPEGRKFSKLMYDPKASQQKRREAALEWQKRRRDDILDKIRQLDGDSGMSDSETEDTVDFVQVVKRQQPKTVIVEEEGETIPVEQMDTAPAAAKKKKHRNRKPYNNQWEGKRRPPPCRVMLSEWLIQKPEDLDDNWIGVLCPVGKRCLVVASRGRTKVFSRTDDLIGTYQSLLPGGRKSNYRDSTHNRARGVTILDCIWSDETQKFYVLDLVCWNSHSCNNCDTEYRQFFLNSKFYENPDLFQGTPLNPFPFIPLPSFGCGQMSEVMMSYKPLFPQKVDGLLLIHKEAFYIPGSNPLCLWVYLTDIERRLGITVSPELLARQKKHKKQRNSRSSNNGDMELEEQH